MRYVKSLAFGLAGGLIGVAVWVAVGYGTGYEVGYIAWGLGLLAGLGVRFGSDDHEGPVYGVLAVLIAVPCILVAKFLVVHFLVGNEIAKVNLTEPSVMIEEIAQEIAEEREAAGKTIVWPPAKDADNVPASMRFPADIWAEAEQRWNQLPEDQRQARIEARNKVMAELVGAVHAAVRKDAFEKSFTPYDLLWFGLAAFTAFRLGSGAVSQE